MLIAFHKPYGVLSQFTSADGKPTLADYIAMPGVYAAGRLDFDSEGLLLLTDDGRLQAAITGPSRRMLKRYWVQVEGIPGSLALARFGEGLIVGEGADRYQARSASAVALPAPDIAQRNPPIRVRARRPTSWIEVSIAEGRNRQVRRMTAAIGHPTVRLLRVGIGDIDLFRLGLASGEWETLEPDRLSDVAVKGHRR